jgi:cytochrome c-type biogenesis protein
MELSFLSLVIPAFIAGVLTFLAPCTLPLVPGYLGLISGVSAQDLKDSEKSKKARVKIFLNGTLFIIGFSVVFIVFGSLAGFVGGALVPWRIWLTRIGGIFIILFGLFMLNVIKIPFLVKERRFKTPGLFKAGKLSNSFLVGSAFGFGWTPCVGPILGSVLFLASTSATVMSGAVLLAVFSAGLAVPFLIIALGFGSIAKYIGKTTKYLKAVSMVGGIFLILLGILLLTNNIGLLLSYGFRFFEFINYDALLDYL